MEQLTKSVVSHEHLIRRAQTDELLTEQDAAAYLVVSVSGMRKWRTRKCGPAYCRFGRLIRYRRSALDEFADLHTNSTTEQRISAMGFRS
jgi:hypothetical protein